ncbi:GGDEF domain-containing protein [Gilvimarinus sp. 1_MG-2023]|nr:GGDEF domain-containing protein [Gilvimarinus sp. 1_MG-2023]
MMKFHFSTVIPLLLFISYFAYKQRYYKYVMLALAIFPIISISGHAYIASKLGNTSMYVPEGYLGIFWIFIASGMTFRYALVSAICATIILLASAFYYIESKDVYVMYVFWVFCSFSFGFLGALIFDRTRKQMFISQQALKDLAITDPLTGVYNRHQLNIILAQEIERGLRYKNTFGLLIIDVDYFKNINDSYGHDVGDVTLKTIAQELSRSIRGNDTLIRWGGEEFIVIAIETNQHQLITLAEKLRENIANTDFSEADKVTISIGTTLFKENDRQSDMLSRADKALYQAKEKGRNTTVYAP